MAKTTSQIIAENKSKRAEEAKIDASRNAIHQQQMAELETNIKEKEKAEAAGVQQQRQAYVEIGLIGGSIGFLLGIIVMFLFYKRKIRKIKLEYNLRINEARASLDRMLIIASREQKK